MEQTPNNIRKWNEICTLENMKKLFLALCFGLYFSNVYAQKWVIEDIVSQDSKELVVLIDDGEGAIEREKIKNPSIVNLINDYQENGFVLEKVTQGVELDLNGSFPINNNRLNNLGFFNLTLSNNNRILLWFKKPKQP